MTDAEGAVTEPGGAVTEPAPRRRYWEAQGLAELVLSEFRAAAERGDAAGQRQAFFHLATYYGRTHRILRTALEGGRDALATAAMRNLLALHRPLTFMHRASPHTVPITLTLDREARDQFCRDLIVRVLTESVTPLDLAGLVERVNALDLLGVRAGAVERHLRDLVETGFAERVAGRPTRYARVNRPYHELDLDGHSLQALLGAALYQQCVAAGFRTLADVDGQRASFCDLFARLTGLNVETARLFADVSHTLVEARTGAVSAWHHADLLGSPYPRPYQYESYTVFRGGGYRGQVVEAPTGAGKTMIGMMCIQDWLRQLRPGQSILVLVPTSNYQQQWTGELCYKPIGLRLSPELIFSGTPSQLERFIGRTGAHPAILLMTYTSLAQAGSHVGKGGFDVDSIETFLQEANVRFVILDEIHKVVEDPHSVSNEVTRLMVEWLQDGSINGLIGFSGTAEAYRSRFEQLGLDLAYTIPIEELIAAGYVAPFAELGVPFSYSARERRVRDLLDGFKAAVHEYVDLLGADRLCAWLEEVPYEERVAIAHDLLGMYRGRSDWRPALDKRLAGWAPERHTGSLSLTDARLVSILQIAHGWTDLDLAERAGIEAAHFEELCGRLQAIREEMATLVYLPRALQRLRAPDFGRTLDVARLRALTAQEGGAAARVDAVRDVLATTIVGGYDGLSDWYLRVGEGRVETTKAVIDAEQQLRPISGIIVFDNARAIRWRQGVATPGYVGVGGLFAQLLGDTRLRPFAALSNELYFPYAEDDPIPPRIAAFVERTLMREEVGPAIFGLSTQGLGLDESTLDALQTELFTALDQYIPSLQALRSARPGEFNRQVLGPVRRLVRQQQLGLPGQRLLARLDRRNVHLAELVQTFFDYAIIARVFRNPRVAELEQVSGARQRFFVIPMGGGNRKSLMYDLTSRIIDAEELPVNLIIVSSWARTGWNVIRPNLLIDATATRDVTAWQQLRGRVIRALRTWTNDCARLLTVLLGSASTMDASGEEVVSEESSFNGHAEPPSDTVTPATRVVLDERLAALLEQIVPPTMRPRLRDEGVAGLTDAERLELAIELMRGRNKVTHTYELVKAFGSTTQIEMNRERRVWQRKEHIALKHARESSVQPLTGELVMGVEHAPLLYARDPREDLPSELQRHLEESMQGSDGRIVTGWLGHERQ
jgi:superfamily II DNA or RNA helicase